MEGERSTYVITGIQAGVTDKVPLRFELDTWYPGTTPEHLIQNNLFIWALQLIQERDPSRKLSFFQIAGIHGLPYQPWDEKSNAVTANQGYCTHDSLLFPCWHRPYMLLYEQVLYEIMKDEIIPQVPSDKQTLWRAAADNWRLPYWDWALKKQRSGNDSPIYDMPLIAKNARIQVVDYHDGVTVLEIDNPMYKFTMPGSRSMGSFGVSDVQATGGEHDFITIPFSKSQSTSRWAPFEPQSGSVSAEWVGGTVNNDMVTDTLNNHPWYGRDVDKVPLAEMVYRLYLPNYISTFTQFATTKLHDCRAPAPYLNLEYIHNNLHIWTGGFGNSIGHMAKVPVAGFDPIFFMHHANIDRLFAIWQAINQNNPRNWFELPEEQLKDNGTWSIRPNAIDTPVNALAPFHKDANGTPFTSNDIRECIPLGYTYPELQPWLDIYKKDGQFNVDLYMNDIRQKLQKLYGPPQALVLKEDEAEKTKSWGPETWTKDIIINVTYDRFALGGLPYIIYLFIGSPSDATSHKEPLHLHPQLVGFVYTFSNPVFGGRAGPESAGCKRCQTKASEGTKSRGQVPITAALVARAKAGEEGLPHGIPPLSSLQGDTVAKYLEENLHWSVNTLGDQVVKIPDDAPFIEISVYHRDARFDDLTAPVGYKRLEEATRNKPGGYQSTP